MSTRPASRDERLWLLDVSDPADIDADTVGAKAANLMRMAGAGLPVPPGFVLSTAVCADYHRRGAFDPGVGVLLDSGVHHIEAVTGLRFGTIRRPLLVAVRSGAAASMPGMLDTVLNIGLCDASLPGVLRATGDPAFVWDSYRRLIQSYAEVVDGCPPAPFAAVIDAALRRHGVPDAAELDVAALRDVVTGLHDVYRSAAPRPFPQDPSLQLRGAVEAVMRSWNSDRALEYRRLEGLEGLPGTAVTVQAMVFGNRGLNSGAGVGFTRHPATGESRLYIDFACNAQGEDVVAGRHATANAESAVAAIPGLAPQLETVARRLEALFGDAQDFEFTVEEGSLWLLQSRTAARTPWAALQIACDLVAEGVIEESSALDRLRTYDLDRISRRSLAPDPGVEPIGHAIPASDGVAAGRIALTVRTALAYAQQGQPVVLVRDTASTDDIAALAVCRGLLTATGARTSHAAVVARQLGVVCLVNCAELTAEPDNHRMRIGQGWLAEGDTITIDSSDGGIYHGDLQLTETRPTHLIERVRAWQGRASAEPAAESQ